MRNWRMGLCGRALFRAGAARRERALWDSELCAGAALRLAGYRPAAAWVRAYRCVERLRSYWCVLRQITPVFFPLSGKERRLAVSCVPIPSGSGSPFVRSHGIVRLSDLDGSLLACAFPAGDPDGDPEEVQEAIGKPPGGRTSLEKKPYHCAVTCNADDYAAIEPQAFHVSQAK